MKLPTVIVLASGRGERFRASGGTVHKLDALIAGRSVRERTLDAVRASGLPWHIEDAGHPGMGDSIAAAVRATPDADGWLILPADLPLTSAATLQRVAAALGEGSWQAVQPACKGAKGHPVGFAAGNGHALRSLGGESGAASVLKTLRAAGKVCDLEIGDFGVITDIDTLSDLAAAETLWVSSSR
ncbi:nucleotidyltransferase family protein [Variovorax sp. RHLX14]|uniref:nucleotidyltransferase family protein n=1 Tax=Variovorax sp. RHLX14 TaxID=1259731 RepID=UPI003F47DD7B